MLPAGTKLGRTALRVTNLTKMTEFYESVVGLMVLNRVEATSTLGVEGTPLLVLEEDEEAPIRPPAGTGLYHNAFRVPSRGALGDVLIRVRDHWHLDGATDHHVSEALYLTDPEDNGIEIYRDFSREGWPRTDDGTVRMGTDPLDLASIEADAAGDSRVPPGTAIGHVHLEVSSTDAFRDFYVDTLGFEVQMNVPTAWFVSAGGYHHHIGANTWRQRTSPAQGRGLAWFEVVLPETSVLSTVQERLTDRGIPLAEIDDSVVVADSDDIEIRLRAETPC